ncbi:phosphatidylserine synthase 1-like [Diadema antillarum]|uniref:phosphatidylserine synthase 1-like n=1 Tax=Diadema antillarum TaxID=105358 RepID=UPI003A8C4875
MAKRGHKRSNSEMSDHFRYINEQEVEDITLEFFYKPHTLTLLLVAVIGTFYFAFTGSSESTEHNVYRGICCAVFYFLIISILAFPNGPFTRPHPAIWRVVFGVSVLYLLVLIFFLFQTYEDVRRILIWLYPDLQEYYLHEKEYAVNCSDVTFERIWGSFDWYSLCHFGGWMLKALLIRSPILCWIISITWEITELFFIHLQANFAECWWDSIVLDVLVCNGLGIWLGMKLCKRLEMTEFQWESIRDIPSTSGKIKRAVLQFTPASWTSVRWLEPTSSLKRVIAVYIMVLVVQLCELNTFFLKQIYVFPADHMIGIIRITIICAITAPTIRQYYTYITDPHCKRVGTQTWVFLAITLIELMACIKHGQEMFQQTIFINIFLWLAAQLIFVLICFYAFWWYYQKHKPMLPQERPVPLAVRRLSQQSTSAPSTPTKQINGLPDESSTNSSPHHYGTRQRKAQNVERISLS